MSALRYGHWNFWLIVRPRGDVLHFPHDEQAVDHSAENHVFTVQEVALGARDEELAAVGVFAAVGHGQQAGRVVFQDEVLVRKRTAAVDAQDTGAVAVNEVAALYHEVLDHAMEARVLEAQRHPVLPVLARTELPEVLRRLRAHVLEQLEDHATYLRGSHRHVEEDDRIIRMS